MSDATRGNGNGLSSGLDIEYYPPLIVDRTMQTYQSPPLSDLVDQPGIDPCDVAEGAMPDLVFGDLTQADEDWVRLHTLSCRYCSEVLRSLEDVCTSLDACNDQLCDEAAGKLPPARVALGLPEARYGYTETPLGDVLIAASDAGICEISYLANHDRYESLREIERRGFLVYENASAVQPAIEQLHEYFEHERKDFSLPLDLTGVTPFTRDVLMATNAIPYGKVQTYGEVATTIGKPRASRAVGNALGRNPIPVIIPCHRVILSSGAMGWYTGGPEIKRTLLGIEGVRYSQPTTNAEPQALQLGL